MKINFLFLLFFFLSSIIICILGNWYDQLLDYDIIPKLNLRFTRSALDDKKFHLSTKYRDFDITLKPSKNLFTNNFKSFGVDKYGKRTPISVDTSQYYQGHVSDESNSSVRAYLGPDKMVGMSIILNDDIFQVESLSRYEHNASSYLVYRFNDLKINHTRGPPCHAKNFTELIPNFPEDHRPKRSADEYPLLPISSRLKDSKKKFCTIKLIADFRFHREHGHGDKTRTQNYLIELIDNINQLFKSTEFINANNEKSDGYGFIINEILIYEDWTVNKPGHFNEQKVNGWNVEDLLNSFGAEDHTQVCLAHLFTYQSFTEGTLGLAWIGTSKTLDYGGICSKPMDQLNNRLKFVNTAWSTYKDAVGNHLISLSAFLVTAHELGHNWGADHDPDTADCSPNAKGGGKYVMYTYSVVGYEKNNRLFSPCSRRSIGATLATRGEYCFQSSDTLTESYCGNSRVEDKEDCDIGRDNHRDQCCTPKCQFRPGAVCSPYNHECCTKNCTLKSNKEICAQAHTSNPCLGNAMCDGISKTCPSQELLTGPACTEHGKCVNGKCRPYCETIDKEPCICDEIKQSCLICCRNRTNLNTIQECKPAFKFLNSPDGNPPLLLNDGRPCAQGFCEIGVCKRKVHKLIERIWKIIDNFNTNAFGAFLLDNLVGAVIIVSLLLWIPAAILVSCHDAKHRKRFITERNIRRPQGTISGTFET